MTTYGALDITQVDTTLTIPALGFAGDSGGTISNAAAGNGTNALAEANGSFDIIVRYSGDPQYQSAFTTAAARWSQIIIADIADVTLSPSQQSQYSLPSTIDDLYIDASVVPLDGPGGLLGQAGPRLIRNGSHLTVYGTMQFDSADVASMVANGTWTAVILHEMGHILGIGTLWDDLGLLNSAGDYIGANALREYRTLSGNPSAGSVPVEHDFGPGTAGAHWDEDRFNAELMTGFVEPAGTPMPISRMTIGSLQDLGYSVNYAAADPYALPGGGTPTPTPSTTIVGDNGNNSLIGTAGNDTLNGLGGDDSINGLGGDDTAIFSGSLASYAVDDFGSFITTTGPDGHDTLFSVEHLQFGDGTVNVVDGSALFDTLFYDRNNLDVFHANVNALAHFNSNGWHEGRDPNPYFSTVDYLAINRDVRASGANPLTHYEQAGWKEGRDPGPNFDIKLYLQHNPDVAAAGVEPLGHYLQFGRAEGRTAYAAIGSLAGGFDAEYYVFHNPDVAAAGVDPLQHFNDFGWKEGRNPNAWFDTAGYLAHYPDVAAAGINPLQHYMEFGWKEGRDPSASFDTLKYLAAYPDVAAAHVNPLDHFYNFGFYEGRSPFGDGVWHA
jgi:hypothetical protein